MTAKPQWSEISKRASLGDNPSCHPPTRPVRVGLIGLGTVGTGVVKILQRHPEAIERRIGAPLRVAAICDQNLQLRPGISLRGIPCTTDYRRLIDDPKIDLIIELIGGYEPARTIVLSAIDRGKHIITANKALLAKFWGSIFTTARARGVQVYFEASVGGGIPVIQALNEGLAANRIDKMMGILNGTTNYILTRMAREGSDFHAALRAAQQAGFAEANPHFDIAGVDTAHKLAILASLATGGWVRLEHIPCEGITDLDPRDIAFAKAQFGYAVKLLGIAKRHGTRLEVRVHPTLIPENHPFASVADEYNALLIHGDSVGDVMLYGKGAGQMAAASAVVSDLIFLARQIAVGAAGLLPYVSYDQTKQMATLPRDAVETRYYLRFMTIDRPGVLAKISGILGRHGVSISAVHQPEHAFRAQRGVPVLILTHRAKEGAVRASVQAIERLPILRAHSVLLRIEADSGLA